MEPWVDLQHVIVAFPGHTHLLYDLLSTLVFFLFLLDYLIFNMTTRGSVFDPFFVIQYFMSF